MKCSLGLILPVVWGLIVGQSLAHADPLPGTKPLTDEEDIASKIVAGIDKFLLRELEQSIDRRAKLSQRDFSSVEAYNKSVAPNREHLAKIIRAFDARVPFADLDR